MEYISEEKLSFTFLCRVEHSHSSNSVEILCSDWLRSWCCSVAAPALLCHEEPAPGNQSPLIFVTESRARSKEWTTLRSACSLSDISSQMFQFTANFHCSDYIIKAYLEHFINTPLLSCHRLITKYYPEVTEWDFLLRISVNNIVLTWPKFHFKMKIILFYLNIIEKCNRYEHDLVSKED